MNNIALALFAAGSGICEDSLICLAIVRALEFAGWSMINPISPDEDELAQTLIFCAQREGVHPRQFVNDAISALFTASDPEAELIRYPAPSHSIH